MAVAVVSCAADGGDPDGVIPGSDSGGDGPSGADATTEGGDAAVVEDAADHDATAVMDASSEASDAGDATDGDAPSDAGDADADATSDATTDAPSDATTDAPGDASGDAADANDAAGDASDAGSDAGDAAASFPTPPTVNGVVAQGEYGDVSVNGRHSVLIGATTWYATWDNTNLYVAVVNASVTEAALVYLETNPLTPSNGGTIADGNLAGFGYDMAGAGVMPVRADLVVYAKSSYRELRTATGSGWSTPPTTAFGAFASSGTTRELSIPWSSVGGRPASFSWFGYVTTAMAFAYGAFPVGNPTGQLPATPMFTKYFLISATAPSSTAFPFGDLRTAP